MNSSCHGQSCATLNGTRLFLLYNAEHYADNIRCTFDGSIYFFFGRSRLEWFSRSAKCHSHNEVNFFLKVYVRKKNVPYPSPSNTFPRHAEQEEAVSFCSGMVIWKNQKGLIMIHTTAWSLKSSRVSASKPPLGVRPRRTEQRGMALFMGRYRGPGAPVPRQRTRTNHRRVATIGPDV